MCSKCKLSPLPLETNRLLSISHIQNDVQDYACAGRERCPPLLRRLADEATVSPTRWDFCENKSFCLTAAAFPLSEPDLAAFSWLRLHILHSITLSGLARAHAQTPVALVMAWISGKCASAGSASQPAPVGRVKACVFTAPLGSPDAAGRKRWAYGGVWRPGVFCTGFGPLASRAHAYLHLLSSVESWTCPVHSYSRLIYHLLFSSVQHHSRSTQ